MGQIPRFTERILVTTYSQISISTQIYVAAVQIYVITVHVGTIQDKPCEQLQKNMRHKTLPLPRNRQS